MFKPVVTSKQDNSEVLSGVGYEHRDALHGLTYSRICKWIKRRNEDDDYRAGTNFVHCETASGGSISFKLQVIEHIGYRQHFCARLSLGLVRNRRRYFNDAEPKLRHKQCSVVGIPPLTAPEELCQRQLRRKPHRNIGALWDILLGCSPAFRVILTVPQSRLSGLPATQGRRLINLASRHQT